MQKATKAGFLGIVLFHTLFIVSPLAGKELFGDAVIGEYFRVFVSYGVIAMALAMHAWKKVGIRLPRWKTEEIRRNILIRALRRRPRRTPKGVVKRMSLNAHYFGR